MKSSNMILLVAVLLAGAAAGYVVGAGGTEPAPPPSDEPAPPSPAEEPGWTASTPSSADYGSLEEWLAAIPAPESERGTGEITGSVTTTDGRPVSGVLIRGTLIRTNSRGNSVWTGAPPEDLSLAEVVRRAVDRHRGSLAGRSECRTDADGAFRLTGLADGTYSLKGWLEGYRIHTGGTNRADVGSVVNFKAQSFRMVPVRVYGPDGRVVEKANVRISSGSRTTTQAWRRDAPDLEIGSGTWTLSAWSGEHGEWRSASVEVVVENGAALPVVELRCEEIRGIRGTVIVPEGVKLPSVAVAAVRLSPGMTNDPERLIKSPLNEHIWGERTGYTFTDIPAGTWLVGVVESSRKVLVSETVEVGAGMAVLDLTIPPPDRSEYVLVTVLGPGDEPLTKVSFRTEYQVASGHSGGGSRVEPVGPGQWRVWHHTKPVEYDEGGEYGIEARTSEYGAMRIWYDRETTSELTFRFEEPAVLVVTVSGYAGSGLEGLLSLSLSSRDEERSSGVSPAAAMTSDGTVRFRPAPPGEYELHVLVSQGEHQTIVAEKIPLTLGSGESHRTVVAPRLYTLTVITDGLPGSPKLRLRPRDRSVGWWGTDRMKPKDGRVVFERIPAGEYVVEVDNGMEMMFVSVPGKSVVRFKGSPINALEVRIRDEDGGLAKAGFRDGDLIIGIDGTEFTDMMQMQSLFGPAMAKEKTTFTVLRGGSRIELSMNLREMMQGDDGGSMEPTSR